MRKLDAKYQRLLLVALVIVVFLSVFPAQPEATQHAKDEIWDFVQKALIFLGSRKSDAWVALFTALTFVVFFCQLRAMWRTNRHFAVTERAYVKMSHITGNDGIALSWIKTGFSVAVEVKNYGRTPAKVTDAILTKYLIRENESFSIPIVYERHVNDTGNARAFLVCNDSFRMLANYALSADDIAAVQNEEADLIFYGYVDYIDKFGVRHRGGYGRQYIGKNTNSNLGYPNIQGLNFDRERLPGEGVDWDDK